MPSILAILWGIYPNQFKSFVLKTKLFFWSFYCIFGTCIKLATFWEKIEPHSLSIYEIIHSEKRGYLNA